MENVLSLPGRGNTYFYFSQMGKDGFSKEQQAYIRDLIAAYRKRYSRLEITAVWDFGMEEGTRYENDKYGVFADCRDLAVSNRDMASISFNQVRVSRMPMDIPAQQLREILEGYEAVREISAMAAQKRLELMSRGTPPPAILEAVNAEAEAYLERRGIRTKSLGNNDFPGKIVPGPHNHLPLEDPCFADVWAIRQLEELRMQGRLRRRRRVLRGVLYGFRADRHDSAGKRSGCSLSCLCGLVKNVQSEKNTEKSYSSSYFFGLAGKSCYTIIKMLCSVSDKEEMT